MRFRTTLRLFFAVCVLAGFTWFLERRSETEASKRELEYLLFDTDIKSISGFLFDLGDLHVICRLEDGVWQIKSPLIARADPGEVERMLNLFVSLPKEEIIRSSQRMNRGLSLKDYGLLDPRARVVLHTKLGVRDVVIGYNAPLGDLVYVMYAGGKDVIAVHKSLLDILPGKVEKLRDKRLLYGEAGMTSRLEIQRPGQYVQMTRADGEWMIRQPIASRADGGKVARLLDKLYTLDVTSFVWDPIVKVEPKIGATVAEHDDVTVADAGYRLNDDEASARITVWVNGDEVGKELILGSALRDDKDKIYAKLKDNASIYSVDQDILDAFTVSLKDLRDKALYSCGPGEVVQLVFEQGDKKLVLSRQQDNTWMVTDPVKWVADNAVVKEVIQYIVLLTAQSYTPGSATNLLEYGLNPCSYSITIHNQSSTKTNKLMLGKLTQEGQMVYGMFEGSSEVMLLPADMLNSIRLNPVDPLVYRDRVMLKVAPSAVKRVARLAEGKEQSVVRGDKGVWSVAGEPSTNATVNIVKSVLPFALESVLLNCSNLRAIRIKEHNPQNLAKYGLDSPSHVLTLGLASDEGIQKSLLIGSMSEKDGRYGMVQGQDVVFVISNDVVAQLTQDLVKLSVKPETNEEKP